MKVQSFFQAKDSQKSQPFFSYKGSSKEPVTGFDKLDTRKYQEPEEFLWANGALPGKMNTPWVNGALQANLASLPKQFFLLWGKLPSLTQILRRPQMICARPVSL